MANSVTPISAAINPAFNSLTIRRSIFRALNPLNGIPKLVVKQIDDYRNIFIDYPNAHTPDYKLVWSEYSPDNYLYRVYSNLYDPANGAPWMSSYSTATIRSVSDALDFAQVVLFYVKHRANNRGG